MGLHPDHAEGHKGSAPCPCRGAGPPASLWRLRHGFIFQFLASEKVPRCLNTVVIES